MHWLSPLFYMEARFGPLKGFKKKANINRTEIVQKNSWVDHFWPQKEWRNFGRAEKRTSWLETKKIQTRLATCNKNEQQDAKNNAEL